MEFPSIPWNGGTRTGFTTGLKRRCRRTGSRLSDFFCNLLSCYAAQIELEKLGGICGQADRGIGRLAFYDACKSLVVNFDGEIFGLAKTGVEHQRHGHGVEERGRFMVPKMIKGGQRVGDRRVLIEDAAARRGVEFQHGRHIERRHNDGNPGGKDHLGRGGVGFDVPFRVGFRAGLVAARDGAPHERDALDLLSPPAGQL